ncbi:MAG: PAS domain S-box protein [Deltaproteobacteria bacterium]|nr:PAS domain S-box protein [Deltaproteobacteria bacterium]
MASTDFLSSAVLEALGHAGIGVAVTVFDGQRVKAIYVSDRAAEIVGRQPEELLDRDIFELVAPEVVDPLREHSQRWENFEPTSQRLEATFLDPGGQRVYTELGFARIETDSGPATVAFIIDVGKRKRAESLARESDDRLGRIVAALPEAVAIIRDGVVASANDAMLEIPGVVVGEPFPADSAELVNALAAPPRSPVELSTELAHSGLYLSVTVFAVDFADSRATVLLARDETARLKMQSQLISADRLASLGSLASGIAHTVNNPLTTVLLNLAALQRDLPQAVDTPDPKLVGQVREAYLAAERVRSSMRRLRGLSSWHESPADIDVRSVLDAVIGLAEYAAGSGIRLVNDYAPVPLVTAEEAKLAQVFLALLRNALEAIPENAASPAEVLIRSFVEDDRVVVEVSDPGTGIADEDLPHVFAPFYTTDARRHSGLGLTTCREIITGLGGTIAVTSPENPTTVRIELPASSDDHRSIDAPAQLLFIEPHVENAARVRNELTRSYDLRLVGSASRGLEVVLGGDRFDLVLCCSKVAAPDPVTLWQEVAARRPGLEDKLIIVGSEPINGAPAGIRRLPGPIDAATIAGVLGQLDGRSE